MKLQHYILLSLLSIVLSQFSANAFNGFGDNNRIISPSSESMGGMWLYNSDANGWDPLRASSLHQTDLTMIAVSSSFGGISTNVYSINDHYINMINFSFPFFKTNGFGVGISPYTRTEYSIEDDGYRMINGTLHSTPLASKNTYNVSGGISKLSLSFSKVFLNKSISLGIRWNILFGNQKFTTITSLAELSYDQNEDKIFNVTEILQNYEYSHFNASSYEIDSRININKNNSVAFLGSFINRFDINQYQAMGTQQLGFSIDRNYLFNKIQLDELAFGYMYNINNNSGIACEGHFKNKLNYPESLMILDNSTPEKLSIHNGVYKIFTNSKSDSWNAINLAAGYSYKLVKFNKKNVGDISISLGTGILFNNSKNNINIALTIGVRESIIETIRIENYYKLNIAILSGDKWFEKRRRD